MTRTRLGTDEKSGRGLYVAFCAEPAAVLALEFPQGQFVCLLAWDAQGLEVGLVSELARHLMQHGCVYICCWGPDCERVHDIFDETDTELHPESEAVVMSTWHSNEPLADAIWFALNSASPDTAHENNCASVVGMAIGDDGWAAQMGQAFADPAGFNKGVLAE